MATWQATWNGTLLAESATVRRVEGNVYFPPDSLRREHLRESSQTSLCLWKGKARYLDVVVGDAVNTGAAWYYPRPTPLARRIRDHVAFWEGVQVRKLDS